MPNEATTDACARYVHAVQRYVRISAAKYAALFDSTRTVHPISFFGDPEEAQIVTVGLNPSIGEFVPARRWPREIDHLALAARCRTYFSTGTSPEPHPWFGPWREALKYFKASYEDGSAAHLDLCPRATRFVSTLHSAWEQGLFLEMVERDLWTFFGTWELCKRTRLILMAGSVTGRYYMNEFIQQFAPRYGYCLDGAFDRLRRDDVVCHTLSGQGRQIPVLFCRSSPSAREKKLLPQCLKAHAEALRS